MPKVATRINHKQLRREMLEYFWKPQRSANIHLLEPFSGYPETAVRRMLYSLDWSGLIVKLFGNTQGSQYQTSREGRWMLERMREQVT